MTLLSFSLTSTKKRGRKRDVHFMALWDKSKSFSLIFYFYFGEDVDI